MLIIIFVILILGIVSGIYLYNNTDFEGGAFALSLISGMILFCIVSFGTINYSIEKSYVPKYNAIKTTIEVARNSQVGDIERATLTNKIMEVNQHLADVRYWKDSVWSIFYPDEVVKLENLK